MPAPTDVTLRSLETRAEFEACVRLQRDTWGPDFVDVVPATILMVSQRVGGVAAGAFDANRRLLGFVFGISGVRDGRLVHWSDMLAVRPEARRVGLGRRLKLYQREQLVQKGIAVASWSFDPLVAQNADLNLNSLGAVPVEYVVDMYGDTGSTLHHGLDTDRIIVDWRLADPDVEAVLAGTRPTVGQESTGAPVANPAAPTDGVPSLRHAELPASPRVRIAVPSDIDTLKAIDPDAARLWQMTVRRAFEHYLSIEYQVTGFQPGGDGEPSHYLLAIPEEEG